MGILYATEINQLLANTAPTGLLFADWLKKEGYLLCKGICYVLLIAWSRFGFQNRHACG